MWNSTSRILVTLLIAATFSSHIASHAHSRMRFRTNGGAGVRGRRDGEVTGVGGYGRASALPALYSAPKLTTFESVRVEQEPMSAMTTAPTPGTGRSSEDAESLEQQATTTEVASDAGVEESPAGAEQMMEDSTMEAITQPAEGTESSSSASSAENEVSVDGGATGTTEAGAAGAVQDDQPPSGRYLSPQTPGRQRDSYGENSIVVSDARVPSGGYYKSNGGDRIRNQYSDSSAAFSSYYSSQTQRSQRPVDQQQVENFNYQQYTPQSHQNQNGNALPASSSQDGGYSGQRSPRPSFDQIAAVEQSFYSTQPNNGNNVYQYQNGNQGNGNGYQQQQQYMPQPQQQQQQQPQPHQLQPQFRYIAQQPEQFYPTPAAGPVQQYLPINPLIEGRQQQQQDPQQNVANIGGVTYSYPDPPPPTHIQRNIAEVVQQNIAEPQFQQRSTANGPSLQTQYAATATLADFPSQNGQDGFSNAINVDSGDDSMDLTFEGLNDNVVDAELLERVQQIIEEHEREQNAFLQRQRESGQGGYGSQTAPVQEMVGPNGLILESPKPSIHYEVDTRQPSYSGNEITPRGGYNSFSSSSNELALQAGPMRFSQQLQQQHQAFGNGNGSPPRGPSQGRALQGKKIANLDVQPAILTQHFMESGTPSNLHRQTFTQRTPPPPANGQQQQQTYLPPRQEYANSEPRPQAAQAPTPSYHDNNQYQYQQPQQQQSQVQSYAAPNANGYQYQAQAQSQPQPEAQSQYVAHQQQQPQPQSLAYSGGYPQQTPQFQPIHQNSQASYFPAGYSNQPQPQFQQQETPQNEDGAQRGGYTQQFRQEYSRPQPQPQVEIQSHGAPQPQPPSALPSYQYSGDTNSIESDSDSGADGSDAGGYEAPQRPNVITKTIVIHEQPAPTYDGQYPAGISNRAIITADDLRGTGLGGITISMQQPQSQPEADSLNEQKQQQQQLRYIEIPQSQLAQYQQYFTPMSQFAVEDDTQRPSMIYLPVYQKPEPQPQPQVRMQEQQEQQQQQDPVGVPIPKPIYGIPLAPALGPESISSLPPSTYGNPAYRQQPQQPQQYASSSYDSRPTYLPPQYSNSVDADADQGQSASVVQDSAAQQSIWDSSLRAIYRLPHQQSGDGSTPNADGGPTNTIPLVSQIVSLPNSDSSSQSVSQQLDSGYGARIGSPRVSRQSIRRRFSHSHAVAVAAAPVTGHRLVSVRTRSS